MTVDEAIAAANAILPGEPVQGDGPDWRWQAIIEIGSFVEDAPEPIWVFVAHWGSKGDTDLRTAVATCLLEHILEHHFATFFPRAETLALSDEAFADTLSLCARFGQSELPANQKRLDDLLSRIFGSAG